MAPAGHRRLAAAVAATSLLVVACGTTAADARERFEQQVENLSVEQVLEDLKDCDKLSDAFVGLVATGAEAVDQLSETTQGRVPETDVRTIVDTVSTHQFFEIAEKIGCNELQSRLVIIDQVNGINPDTPEGAEYLEEILRQIEATG